MDSNGTEHDLNEFLDVTITSSPKMGSDRESTQFTKIMTPLASKSFVLATPDNYEYFLSRYNMFSYIDAYNTTDDQYLDDDNVIYIFAVPDAKKKLAKNQDYFSMPEQEMFLDQGEYDAMHKVLEDSGQQMVTTEVVFVKPQVRHNHRLDTIVWILILDTLRVILKKKYTIVLDLKFQNIY